MEPGILKAIQLSRLSAQPTPAAWGDPASGIGRLYSYFHVLVLDGQAGDPKVTNLL